MIFNVTNFGGTQEYFSSGVNYGFPRMVKDGKITTVFFSFSTGGSKIYI